MTTFQDLEYPTPHMKLQCKVSPALKVPAPLGRFQTTLPFSCSTQSTDGLQDVLGAYPGIAL